MQVFYRCRWVCVSMALAAACSGASGPPPSMNTIAEQYVRLILAIGQHDANYVDAYYGPEEWRPTGKRPLEELASAVEALAAELAKATPASEELSRLRHEYLARQLDSARSRIVMLQGRRLRFDEESKALYDAVAPTQPEEYFERLLGEIAARLPGPAPLREKYDAFRKRFVIPKEKLDHVFRTALNACRERTLRHIPLPPEETFTVEYVTGKSWSAYNWYKGNFRSVIQVNTDLPVYIDRAIDLACHEGYPGHHVYNALLEKHLVRDRGWMEFTVYPLFSPQSLIAEGTANYGIAVAFPGAERLRFEEAVLFPAAGLDPASARGYYETQALVEKLAYAGNEAARRYLNGEIDAGQAASWLERYTLASRARAEQRVRFFDEYRSYVINYNLGMDMVRKYVESRSFGSDDKRWTEFAALLSSPRLPSGLQ